MSDLKLNQRVSLAHESGDYDALISLMPYAKLLGMQCVRLGEDMVFRLPAHRDNIGNPMLPALHGGVIAGFMEHAAMLHLLMFMGMPHLPKIIDFSIDYLRAGHYRDTYAQCPGVAARSTGNYGLANQSNRAYRHGTGAFQGRRALSAPTIVTSRRKELEWMRC
jgi:acyl-coenzyme A thioesterase PaaI-like protein